MSDRDFAAAHDRYLEPPDITDGWPEEDEMDLAAIAKQRRIDEEDAAARKAEDIAEDRATRWTDWPWR